MKNYSPVIILTNGVGKVIQGISNLQVFIFAPYYGKMRSWIQNKSFTSNKFYNPNYFI